MNRQLRRIVVMIPQGYGNSAKTMRGIIRFARPGRPWTFLLKDFVSDLDRVREWEPDGAIAYPLSDEQMGQLQSLGCPVVCVSDRFRRPGIGAVAADSVEAGRLAARHLLDRGFREFGFVGEPDVSVCERRRAGFEEALGKLGFTTDHYYINLSSARRDETLTARDRKAIEWLTGLPRPVGILAWRDLACMAITEACLRAGMRVPQDIAIVGVDNDEAFCEMGYPTISSVAMPFENVGYLAAEMLEQMMDGEAAPSEPLLLPPRQVVARQSTDVLAVDDPLVTRTIDYIRAHAGQGISVSSLLKIAGVSRRSLENRFKSAIGRTPLEEIHRARVELAKQYLNRDDMPLQDVARACGFASAKRLTAIFHKFVGISPADYRKGA